MAINRSKPFMAFPHTFIYCFIQLANFAWHCPMPVNCFLIFICSMLIASVESTYRAATH